MIDYSAYSQKALDFFHQGYNCAQSVFASFGEHSHGMSEQQALALSSPFGAGIGRMRDTCGAFIGLSMLCGILKNNTQTSPEERGEVYELIQKLADEFKNEFGSIYCRDLLAKKENASSTPIPEARTPAYYEDRPCERCVRFCAALGGKMIEESRKANN